MAAIVPGGSVGRQAAPQNAAAGRANQRLVSAARAVSTHTAGQGVEQAFVSPRTCGRPSPSTLKQWDRTASPRARADVPGSVGPGGLEVLAGFMTPEPIAAAEARARDRRR